MGGGDARVDLQRWKKRPMMLLMTKTTFLPVVKIVLQATSFPLLS